MSVWRDVQEAGRNARRKQGGGARGRVRVTGADGTVVRVKRVKTVRRMCVELVGKWRAMGRSKVRHKTARGYKSEKTGR